MWPFNNKKKKKKNKLEDLEIEEEGTHPYHEEYVKEKVIKK